MKNLSPSFKQRKQNTLLKYKSAPSRPWFRGKKKRMVTMMHGQLDIFSCIEKEEKEPPILLSKGQTVYLVNKAEVIKCTVADNENSWVCGDNNRGYRLVKENGLYSCTWNDRILGKEAFTDYESAKSKADEYLKLHNKIIFAGDIKPVSTVAYAYIRDCDNRKMTAFYCDLGDDMYYIKEFMTYHHIIKGSKAIKKFMEQQEFKYCSPKEIKGFVPHFKNMYKCAEQSNWDYAECEYTYAIG